MRERENRRKFLILFLLLAGFSSFFICSNFLKAEPINNNWGKVVINEIMWSGSSISSSDEWLELRNLTDNDIDFSKTNWKIYKKTPSGESLLVNINKGILYANDYFLIARKRKEDSILNIDPDLIASFSLNNENVQYKLYDEQNNLVDVADDGEGSPLAGSNLTFKASMERNLNPGDGTLKESWHTAKTSFNLDLDSQDLGTPKTENSRENQIPKVIAAWASPNSIVADGQSKIYFQIQVQDPDGEEDITQVIIDLSKIGGKKEEMNNQGNGVYNFETAIPLFIAGGQYNIPITIYDKGGNIVETRILITIIVPTYSNQIIINELYPNPPGSDENDEFIELKNIGGEIVDLKDWQVRDKSTSYKINTKDFDSTLISPGGFFVIYRSKSKIALNNSGEEVVSLLDPSGQIKSQINYFDAKEGQAFAYYKTGWAWTATPTPGKENIFNFPLLKNQNPKAILKVSASKAEVGQKIIFDATSSSDPEGDKLSFWWDFGDGHISTKAKTSHSYKKAGQYKVKLKVEDSHGGKDEKTITLKIFEAKEVTKKPKGPFSREIIITEVFPNPAGYDFGEGSEKSGEWIEIKNKGKKEVNLSFWQIDDEEGGSRPYTIKNKTIKPGQYLVFYYPETKVNLNNESDKARLLDPEGKIASQISYFGAKENLSFAFDEKTNKWYWTQKPTPGAKNIIQEPIQKVNRQQKSISSFPLRTSTEIKNTFSPILQIIPIQEARQQPRYTKVKIQGTVLVEPGLLGRKIFYLQDETAGIQVYFSKEDFPKLALGDLITVVGKISWANEEKRILLASREDINILGHSQPPKPKTIKTGKVSEDDEGMLVEVMGKVIKKMGANIYLDDGSGQIRVYLSKTANIKKEGIKKGEEVKIFGIVSRTKSGFRILPRYENDILVGEEIAAAKAEKSNQILANKKLPQVGNSFLVIFLLALALTISLMMPKIYSLKKVRCLKP